MTDTQDRPTSDIIDTGAVALIYVIDPPNLLTPSIPLLLSIRRHHPNATVIPYCPKGKLEQIPERIRQFHIENNAPIQELTRELEFARRNNSKPYYHGHKILAAAEKRDTKFCIWLDTDTYLAQRLDDARLFQGNKIAAVPESVAGYAGRFMEVWDKTYAVFGLETPPERMKMVRTTNVQPPYFNAGFIAFPEVTERGERFGELWLDTAMIIDFDETLDHERKRPWLDQASLPVAIFRGGCGFEQMEPEFNYPIDVPDWLPHDGVKLYHYHGIERLEATKHFSEMEDLVVSSGYFRSLEHHLHPMVQRRKEQAVYWKRIALIADERREYAEKMRQCENKAEQRPFKQEIQKRKVEDKELRAKKDAILEHHFYDETWLVKCDENRKAASVPAE